MFDSQSQLTALGLSIEQIDAQVALALSEDIGSGDVTAALIPGDRQVHARVISREEAVLCGGPWFDSSFRQLSEAIRITWLVNEGDLLTPDQTVCTLQGPARAILSGERVALNFLQTLSGTASHTRRYASVLSGLKTQVLDTRKTVPGLRLAQKYAVACGGGSNHRIGLYDMVLIKENHIESMGSIESAVQQARILNPDLALEVEVENLDQLQQALDCGADRILLDNMPVSTLKMAVDTTAGRARLEASGNITLENIREIAETGVDYVSIGGLTKHIQAVDFSMRFEGK